MGFKILLYHIGSTTFIWSLLNFFLAIVVSLLMGSVNITVCEFGDYYMLLRTQFFFCGGRSCVGVWFCMFKEVHV
jgi:NADH:ubiquinone oxidoreductase subunit K